MAKKKKVRIFAVLTGDIVRSGLAIKQRPKLLSALQKALLSAEHLAKKQAVIQRFTIFRGDSFQGVLSAPEEALRIALFIRSQLLQERIGKNSIDAKVAIGIGTVEFFSKGKVELSDGEAFRYAGVSLDKIEKSRRIAIKLPWPSPNTFCDTICAILDAVVSRWTTEQAEAISFALQNKTQAEIADVLKITQSAVQQRQQIAGWYAIKKAIDEFQQLVRDNIRSEPNKP